MYESADRTEACWCILAWDFHLAMTFGRMIAAGIALLLFPTGMLAQTAQSIAGSIKKVTGDVVVRRGSDRMPAKEGMHILPNDIVETAAGASIGLIMQDGTRVALGPNTALDIEKFRFQPAQGELGLV